MCSNYMGSAVPQAFEYHIALGHILHCCNLMHKVEGKINNGHFVVLQQEESIMFEFVCVCMGQCQLAFMNDCVDVRVRVLQKL